MTTRLGDSWTCHVCGDERPDRVIGVRRQDVSASFNLPPGTVTENVRYCLDRPECAGAASAVSFTR